MLDNVINDNEFSELMQTHIQEMIIHFFNKEQNFGILCKIEDVNFNPALPKDIESNFNQLTLFFLAGYTFESATIQDNNLVFEAGFGAENIGSLVSVPLVCIMQIIIDETPILINLALPMDEEQNKSQPASKGVEDSMASFLSNPENSKFLKN